MEYVILDRQFERFSDEAHDSYLSFLLATMSWSDLLEKRFVVILGEAGTGKTVEMKERARELREAGQKAVFVRFDDLVHEDFDKALFDDDAEAFKNWDGSSEKAVFFLDAIDEAKLNASNAFNRALRKFVAAIQTHGDNVSVVLSCRPSDWQYRTDMETVRNALGPLMPATTAETTDLRGSTSFETNSKTEPTEALTIRTNETEVSIQIVCLCPLDAGRIRLLAEACGVPNVCDLMRALEDQDQLFLAERPRDVEWVANYWKREGRLGTLWEMLGENVSAKLEELNQFHRHGDPLSPKDAEQAAEQLAAATIFCRQTTIRIPDQSTIIDNLPPALDAQLVLEDCRAADIEAFLRRPLFDEASAGRVRFHHRTTQNYLAARWLLRRLDDGCPTATIVALLVGSIYGRLRAIPSMREVAGWVACRHAAIRKVLIEAAPDVVLLLGDAAQIPIEDRARALRAFARAFAGNAKLDWVVNRGDYARLADAAFDGVIDELIKEPAQSNTVKRFLLGIIEAGQLPKATTAALEIVTDSREEMTIRCAAIATANSGGTNEQKQMLRNYALSKSEPNSLFRVKIGASLFPGTLSIDDLVVLISDSDIVGDENLGPMVARDWVGVCPPSKLLSLLEALMKLAISPPLAEHGEDNEYKLISKRFGWLIEPVIECALRLTETLPANSQVPDPLVKALLIVQSLHKSDVVYLHRIRRLKKAIGSSQPLRKAIMRADICTTYRGRDSSVTFFEWDRHIYETKLDDIEWLLVESAENDKEEARFALLNSAISIWIAAGRPVGVSDELARAVETSGLPSELAALMRRDLQPLVMRGPSRAEALMAEREQKQATIISNSRKKLEKQLAGIGDGTAFPALSYIVGQLLERPGASHSRWGQTNSSEIEQMFGAEVSAATLEGLSHVWRGWMPPLPSQRDDSRTIEHGVIVGLTALAIAESEGFDFTTLSDEEVGIATHYALREMNGFPSWFDALAAAKPDIIGSILIGEIKATIEARS